MKVGVLMGGISSEREVSIESGKSIVDNLDKNKYEVIPILINSKNEVLEKVKGIDFAFLAFHGEFGEDGAVQTILELMDIPYSGSGPLSSGICMNKSITKRILKSEGIRVAKDIIIRKGQGICIDDIEEVGYPLVVKPNCGGSSIGVSIVRKREELIIAIEEALKHDNKIIIEEYLCGREYTIPVLNEETLPIIEISSKGSFYDYNSKYDDGGSVKRICKLSKDLEEEINKIGRQCYRVFDCKAYVRVDFIISNNKPYVLELNTLPGMTSHSLFPISANAIGMSYSELLDKIIEYSLL